MPGSAYIRCLLVRDKNFMAHLYRLTLIFMIISSGLLTTSCKQSGPNPDPVRSAVVKSTEVKPTDTKLTKVTISDLKGHLISEIVEPLELVLIEKSWFDKTVIIFKRRPDFAYKLDVDINGKREQWLYASQGVVTKSGKEYSAIYKMPGKPLFEKYLVLEK